MGIALRVVRALAEDEFARDWSCADEHEVLPALAPPGVREAVERVDHLLRFEMAEDFDDEDLDDDETEDRLREHRLQYWSARLSAAEASEAVEYRLMLFVKSVHEFAGFTAMVIERMPDLRRRVEQQVATLLEEIERLFGGGAGG